MFGNKSRAVSLGPKPENGKKKKTSSEPFGGNGRRLSEGDLADAIGELVVPEESDRYAGDSWTEGDEQDFAQTFTDYTEEAGGPEKALAHYRIPIGFGQGRLFPEKVKELRGKMMVWGVNRRRKLHSIRAELQTQSKEARLIAVGVVRGVKGFSDNVKRKLGITFRQSTNDVGAAIAGP